MDVFIYLVDVTQRVLVVDQKGPYPQPAAVSQPAR
jgi:hypothetical protein